MSKKPMTFEEACKQRLAYVVLMANGLMDKNGDLIQEAILKVSEENKKLFAWAIQWWGEDPKTSAVVVATLHQLSIPPGRVSKGGPPEDKLFRLDRKERPIYLEQKVEVETVLAMNKSYKNSGRYYEFHEDKTIEFQEALADNIQERKDNAEKEKVIGNAFKEGIAAIATPTEKKPAKAKEAPTVKTWVVDINEEIIEAPEGYNPDDYLAVGTKAHCIKYLNDEKEKIKKTAAKK